MLLRYTKPGTVVRLLWCWKWMYGTDGGYRGMYGKKAEEEKKNRKTRAQAQKTTKEAYRY